MIRWEYRQFLFEADDKILEKLNAFGEHGWEAFHFRDIGLGRMRVLFKRQKPTPTEEQSQ
jgi:hypothetical protein